MESVDRATRTNRPWGRDSALEKQMDRTEVKVGKPEDLDREERAYWSRATVEEKLQTITYLRECFYGPEATTGRLQRIHTVLKQA